MGLRLNRLGLFMWRLFMRGFLMRGLFEDLADLRGPNVSLDVLSMGMTHSYRVAVEEGANMVRIGTAIFGPRPA